MTNPLLQGSDTPERCADVTWDMRGHGVGRPVYEANVGDLVWNPKGGEGHVLVAEARCGEKHNGSTVDCGCGGWLVAYGAGPCTSTVRICECGEDDSWRDHHYEVLRMAPPVIQPLPRGSDTP